MRPFRSLVFSLTVIVLAACGRPAPAPSDPSPPGAPASDAGLEQTVRGFFDVIDSDAVAHGWALAPALGSAPVEVAFFLDGADRAGTPLATVKADQPRADVNAASQVEGDHGFAYPLPDTLRDGQEHQLSAYGVGPGGLLELENSPLKFKFAAPCSSAGPRVDATEDEYVVNLQADNGKYLAAECGGDDSGLVHADRDTAGEWEEFYVLRQPGGAVSIRSSHGRVLSAEGGGGAEVHASRASVGPWELFHLEGTLTDGAELSFKAPDDSHYLSARVDRTPPPVDATATAAGPWETFKLHVIHSPVQARRGIVRAESRSFVDDDGAFYPLGGTLFWSLYGWKNDRDRLKQNLDYLKQHHYDYVRILGEVDWAGEAIDPAWPDYQQVLGEFLDYAYDTCGLRTELTLVGGSGDPMAIAQKVVPVITAGRQHKILNLEVANESYGRPLTLAAMQAAGRYLRQNLPNLVALSSGEGLNSYAPGSTDWRADYVSVYMPADAANLGTIHMDRGYGDFGWREVRQPWDWKDFPFPVSHNEPIGPRSSVAEETDPVRLAMLRAVGLINGVGAFILHNGAGVAGRVDPGHNRPANLWEVPGIDAVMDAVRGVDAWMPPRVGEGNHWNNAWTGNPWVADAFWSDGADHGVNRNYTVSTSDGWVSTVAGVKDRAVFTASRHSRVEVFDVLKGKTREVELPAGQSLTLVPDSLDSNGYGAFIIVGHYL